MEPDAINPLYPMMRGLGELWLLHQPYFVSIWLLLTIGNKLIDHYTPEEEPSDSLREDQP